ncbi:hypothetical protein GF336_02940 [Candidatus Woesearchaeota archaeon]|nr:hypothetical protein [Candidatus Woesearchaeota archaeon]
MSEKKLVVDQQKLTYEGLFDLKGLYRVMDQWFYDKGYDKEEIKNEQKELATGKTVYLEMRPYKKTTDYFKNIIRIRMQCTNVKDVEVEKAGKTIIINQGKVRIVFDCYLESDYEDKWESKPFFFFLRTIFDKYIFRSYFNKFEKWLLADFYDLHSTIQRFLNLYRYEKNV